MSNLPSWLGSNFEPALFFDIEQVFGRGTPARTPVAPLTGSVIFLISAIVSVSQWCCCSAAEAGILFLVAESKPAAVAVAQFQFAAGGFAPFFAVLACNGTQTTRARPEPGVGQNRGAPLQFHAEFVRGAWPLADA